jgi:hypothetical protein
MWTQQQAIALCREIEAVAPEFGCHVALTGGCLYKDGDRKDLDLLFYRIRNVESIDVVGLFTALEKIGVRRDTEGEWWCIKAHHETGRIDCFFPECDLGDYDEDKHKATPEDPYATRNRTTDGTEVSF